MTASTHSPFTACSIAQFELQQLLGEGAFGEVYKARNTVTDTFAAVKILKQGPRKKMAQRQQRFLREIAICERLQHPNVVKLLHHGPLDKNGYFAAFEYLKGLTLRDYLLTQRVFNPVIIGKILQQLLNALLNAHQLGIVHRDLKPSNIMLLNTHKNVQVKLMDFGISRWKSFTYEDPLPDLTSPEQTLGTPLYCAPEQLKGQQATERSDIYAWGLLLHECLTGAPAIVGRTYAEICYQQLLPTSIPLPSMLAQHPIGKLLAATLEKKESARIGSIGAVLKQFRAIDFSSIDRRVYHKSAAINAPTETRF